MVSIAQRVEKKRLRKGTALETVVDLVAISHLIIGAIIAFVLLMTLSLWGLAASASTMFAAFQSWLLLRCLAEHLRLQKKIASVEFEGKITGPIEETVLSCGNCGQVLLSDSRCDSCGAQIETNET